MSPLNFREALCLWPAYQSVVEYITSSDPRSADPRDVHGAICAADPDRLAALLYGHHHGASLTEAAAILEELRAMTRDGRRPRFGREMGITRDLFEGLL